MFITKKEYERRVEKAICEALERRERERYECERFEHIAKRTEELERRMNEFGQAAKNDGRNIWKSIEEIYQKLDTLCTPNT